jgi:hypothetical protein
LDTKKEGFIASMLLHAITIYTVFVNGRDNSLASILVEVEALSYNALVLPGSHNLYGYN